MAAIALRTCSIKFSLKIRARSETVFFTDYSEFACVVFIVLIKPNITVTHSMLPLPALRQKSI